MSASSDGHPYLVMELLDGQTLRERINGKPLETDTTVNLGIEIADVSMPPIREASSIATSRPTISSSPVAATPRSWTLDWPNRSPWSAAPKPPP